MTTIWPFGAFLLLAAYSDICMAQFAGSVNLMEGTFTCESMSISKTLDISKLCDSRKDCFLVHEKFRIKQKCTYDCPIYDGKMCTNHGACIQHKCICNKGWSGPNCSQPSLAPPKKEPCNPSPCGPWSQCRIVNGQAVCSCMHEMIGSPPTCRPECTISSECPTNRACLNRKCTDPCPRPCGVDSRCEVINHSPVCSCRDSYTGDPFRRCFEIKKEKPTTPSPCSRCGPHTQCTDGQCRCIQEYLGDPYAGCRPECVIDSDCPHDKACIRSKCRDPCKDACGKNALCDVDNHAARCNCPNGMTGNAHLGCSLVPGLPSPDPCNPSPCGLNSQCRKIEGKFLCLCIPGYLGSPPNCHPKCNENSDCPANQTCINGKCVDPCPRPCGVDSRCEVINHSPVCSCRDSYTGDPFRRCFEIKKEKPTTPSPCSRCGPHTQCTDGQCRCIQEYLGDPYAGCRPECVIDSDCPHEKACIRSKCRDPCKDACGKNALCDVDNHAARCNCPNGMTGNAHLGCSLVPGLPSPDPCNPSPCGLNSQCRKIEGKFLCLCIPGYLGSPPNCHPKCNENSDCPANQTCINGKCVDPCPGDCGQNATCQVSDHMQRCSCPDGYTGNPFKACTEMKEDTDVDPCKTSDCGLNSLCQAINGTANCSCQDGYIGPPPSCIPKCSNNSDCPLDEACKKEKCQDPCDGFCDESARCQVVNHEPNCTCGPTFIVDPQSKCYPIANCSDEKNEISDGNGKCICQQDSVRDDQDNCVSCRKETGMAVTSDGRCVCWEGYGYKLNKEGFCKPYFLEPKKLNCSRPDIIVELDVKKQGFEGLLYVEGHKDANRCHKKLTIPSGTNNRTETFNIRAGYCNVVDESASFVLVVRQDSPSPYTTAYYLINCTLNTFEEVKPMIIGMTTDSMHSNTLKITLEDGHNVYDSYSYKNLQLRLEFESTKYGRFPHNCVAYIMQDRKMISPITVTDKKGCATNSTMFSEWETNPTTGSLNAIFDPALFSVSENITFQCHILVCNGRCSLPADCQENNLSGEEHSGGSTTRNLVNVTSTSEYLRNFKTEDIPMPNSTARCFSDKIQVGFSLQEQGFTGRIHVIDYENDENCYKNLSNSIGTTLYAEITIRFDQCGVDAEQQSFWLLVQNDLSPYNLQVYSVNCSANVPYSPSRPLGNGITSISDTTTPIAIINGTITRIVSQLWYEFTVTNESGSPISTTEGNENLQLRVKFEEQSIYTGFAHDCVAKMTKGGNHSELNVTDNRGCPTNEKYFSQWAYDADARSLIANFTPVEFPSSDDITFHCKIRFCINSCVEVIDLTHNYCEQVFDYYEQNSDIDGALLAERTITSTSLRIVERDRNDVVKDIPMPNSTARCFSDKIQVGFSLQEQGFTGRIHVIDYENDENCYKNLSNSFGTTLYAEITIRFDQCGVDAGQRSFWLLVQNDLSPYNLQVYSVNCSANVPYSPSRPLGNGITSISDTTTPIAIINGTITRIVSQLWYEFTVTNESGSPISTTEGNENLQLRVKFEEQSIYTGFAHDCVAKMTKGGNHSELNVTDNRGCPTNEKYLSQWAYDADARSLIANFTPVEFPSSDDITFHCKIRFCINSCLEVIDLTHNNCEQVFDCYEQNSDIDGALLAERTITSTSLRIVERDRNDVVKENWRPVAFSNGTWLPNSVKVLYSVQDQEFKGKLYVNSEENGANEMCYRALSGTTPSTDKLKLEISYGRCGVDREKGFDLIVRDNLQQDSFQLTTIDFKYKFVRYNKTIINRTWVANEDFEILPSVPAFNSRLHNG